MASESLINDIVFRAVFAKEENKYILICLLNAILDLRGNEKITEITLLNPFIDRDYIDSKLLVLDIKAKDGQGRLYNLEVQINPPKNYINRVVYYLVKLLGDQLSKGEDYTILPKTISISIIDSGIIFKEEESIQSIFRFKNTKTSEDLTDLLEIHFIELDKFKKNKSLELSTRFEKWLYLLKYGEVYKSKREEIPKELKEEEGIPMAIERYQETLADERFRISLLEKEMAIKDRNTFIAEAKAEGMSLGMQTGIQQGMQTGMQKGIQQGMQKGIQQGMQTGIQQGMQTGRLQEKKSTAKKMKEIGIALNLISIATGLSEEEIKIL